VVLVECSPHPVLLPAIQEVVAQEGLCVQSLRRNEPERRTLLESMAALHVRGISIDWLSLEGQARQPRVALPTYPWQRERFWIATRAFHDGAGQMALGEPQLPENARPQQPAFDAARHPLRREVLALQGPEARRELLEVSICRHVSAATKLAADRIERQRTLDLDSLMAGWCRHVDAWVRPENLPSVAAFRRAGFSECGDAPERAPPGQSQDGALLFRLS